MEGIVDIILLESTDRRFLNDVSFKLKTIEHAEESKKAVAREMGMQEMKDTAIKQDFILKSKLGISQNGGICNRSQAQNEAWLE